MKKLKLIEVTYLKFDRGGTAGIWGLIAFDFKAMLLITFCFGANKDYYDYSECGSSIIW